MKIEVVVLGSSSLIVLMVSVDLITLNTHESSKGSKICLWLFLDREIPLFFQQCNGRDVEN